MRCHQPHKVSRGLRSHQCLRGPLALADWERLLDVGVDLIASQIDCHRPYKVPGCTRKLHEERIPQRRMLPAPIQANMVFLRCAAWRLVFVLTGSSEAL